MFSVNKVGVKSKLNLGSTFTEISKKMQNSEKTWASSSAVGKSKADLSKLMADCIHIYDDETRKFYELSKEWKFAKKDINRIQDMMINNLDNNIEDMKIGT